MIGVRVTCAVVNEPGNLIKRTPESPLHGGYMAKVVLETGDVRDHGFLNNLT